MGHRNPDQFFNDPMAVNPQTGQLLHPLPAPPQPPPDPKLLALQARLQADQLAAAHKAQMEREKAQADAIHQQVKMQAEIEIARIRAGLDAKIAVLDAHLKALGHEQKREHAQEQHRMDVAEAALDFAASAARREMKRRPNEGRGAMSDESTLERAAARAVRAKALLDDEILNEAFAALEKSYVAAWRATTVDDAAGREKLFLAINIVGKVRDHLAGVVANGQLARAELKELAETAERRKRFGII